MLPATIATTDFHTAGEPFRVVVDPPVRLPGSSVAQRRVHAIEDPDAQLLRAVLCSEPRGHADMYGGFVVPPDDDGAHLGVLFWHKDGFSTACGHGTIALGVWAVQTGRVAAPATGSVDVVVDVPSGRVTARVHCQDGRVVAVDFVSVPSWVVSRDVAVETSRGGVHVVVCYGGATYATLPAARVGLTVQPEDLGELIRLGREIKRALDGGAHAQHPTDPRLNGVYGTIWYDELGDTEGQVHQRNVTVFADGEVDRSPCGSGTAARIAALAADGRLADGTRLRHDSIVGTTFIGRVVEELVVDGRPAVIPQVTGMAYRTGEHRFTVDPHDPLVPGFVLR
jgi:proline racemase/trans-L-3-hydroxyproline dehydratase